MGKHCITIFGVQGENTYTICGGDDMLTMFGKQLRNLRIERNQKLKDMAEKLDVTVAYLSAVENGKRVVPDSWIGIISDEYGLSNEEICELQEAAYENKNDIKINLNGANDAEMELVLSFARRFKTLSDEQVNELQKILDEG